MTSPGPVSRCSALLEPVQAIAVSATDDDIRLAIVVDVVSQDRKPCFIEVPIGVPPPPIMVRIDVLIPAKRGENVSLTIAVNIGDPNAVTVMFFSCERMYSRLGTGEVDPEGTGVVVMSQSKIWLAVAVDIG